MGVQFDTLFTDGLYEKIGKEAIRHARRIRSILLSKGYPLAWESPTNQQFIILSDAEAEKLGTVVGFDLWGRADDSHWIARFTASWSTTDEAVDELSRILPERGVVLLFQKIIRHGGTNVDIFQKSRMLRLSRKR